MNLRAGLGIQIPKAGIFPFLLLILGLLYFAFVRVILPFYVFKLEQEDIAVRLDHHPETKMRVPTKGAWRPPKRTVLLCLSQSLG